MINRLKIDRLDVRGKLTHEIATRLTGTSSGFREVFDQFGITPFNPQSQIDKLGILERVSDFQSKIGVIGSGSILNLSQVRTILKDTGVKIDWLN